MAQYALITLAEEVFYDGDYHDVVAVVVGSTMNVPDTQNPADITVIVAPKMWIWMDNLVGISFADSVPSHVPIV